MNVRWHCGYYVGESKWHGTERYEPDECDTEFDTEVDEEDWEDGQCEAICPKCGAKLDQEYDCPTPIVNKN